jgi:hypothetical protein
MRSSLTRSPRRLRDKVKTSPADPALREMPLNKNLDPLKRATKAGAVPRTGEVSAPPQAERRRCPRWHAHVPVFVYGHSSGGHPFHEAAYSTIVSDAGALLVMTATVEPGETLLLINKVTQEEQQCRVAHVGQRDPQSVGVAVEFPTLAPNFWRVTAPPRRAESLPPVTQRRKTN